LSVLTDRTHKPMDAARVAFLMRIDSVGAL
jgi:hypothetical protein